MAIKRRFKLLFAMILLLALGGALEFAARVSLPFVLPDVGSRGDQWRETLMIECGMPPKQADRLISYDPELFWRLRPLTPDFKVRHPDNLWVDVATNALGLRDDEVSEQRPERQLRALCVGDSCTYGSGVRRNRAWPAVLEQMLAKRGSTGEAGAGALDETESVDIINAGVPGYTAHQGVLYLERDGLALHPDIVIFTLGFNDRRSWGNLSDAQHAAFAKSRSSFLGELLNSSRFVQVVRHLQKSAEGDRAVDRSEEARTQPRVSKSEYRLLLAQAAELTASAGAHILYVLWPVSSNISSPRPRLNSHQRALVEFCAETGNALVVPIQLLRPYRNKVYLGDDVHMTPTGNRLVARAIRDKLLELGWLDE